MIPFQVKKTSDSLECGLKHLLVSFNDWFLFFAIVDLRIESLAVASKSAFVPLIGICLNLVFSINKIRRRNGPTSARSRSILISHPELCDKRKCDNCGLINPTSKLNLVSRANKFLSSRQFLCENIKRDLVEFNLLPNLQKMWPLWVKVKPRAVIVEKTSQQCWNGTELTKISIAARLRFSCSFRVLTMAHLGLLLASLSMVTVFAWWSFSFWESAHLVTPRPTEAIPRAAIRSVQVKPKALMALLRCSFPLLVL